MTALKITLFEKNRTQRWLAKETGIPESYLSMYIRGKFLLSQIQKTKIAQALACETSVVFGEAKTFQP
jgi:transcriptional regulator with XRE-family HTH domain